MCRLKVGLFFLVWGLVTARVAWAQSKPEIAPKTESPVSVGPLFYPSPPEEPRLQFLKSFSASDDFESPPSAFKKFIVGGEKKPRPVLKPYGVTVHDKKIYLCDTIRGGIDVFDFSGRKFRYLETPQLMLPVNLEFDALGNMYVADSRRGQVLIFDKNMAYVSAIGKSAEFRPTDVLVRGDRIYICDIKSNSVKVFALKDRTYVMSIPSENAKPEERLYSPSNLAMDAEGNLYVSDMGAFHVQKYGPDGKYLMTIGAHGDAFGQFARPKGVAVDKDKRLYVVDAAFENVQIFDEQGKLLLFFPESRQGQDSLILPAAITLDDTLIEYFSPIIGPDFHVEYLVLVTSQYGDKKLSVFGFGRRKNAAQ